MSNMQVIGKSMVLGTQCFIGQIRLPLFLVQFPEDRVCQTVLSLLIIFLGLFITILGISEKSGLLCLHQMNYGTAQNRCDDVSHLLLILFSKAT